MLPLTSATSTPFFSGSIWWVFVAVIIIGAVWESNAFAGGLLLLVAVFGMLLTAAQKGTINFAAA